MDAGEYLAGPEAARLIARAARVARTAVSVHAYLGPESAKVAGCGTCAEACAFVHTLPWGPQACRRSREKPAHTALVRNRAVSYLCHMGFACVAAPVGPDAAAHVATFGPFSPAETPAALDHDARDGLALLEQSRRDELPFTLTDIPSVHSEVVPEVAEWLQETLLKQIGSFVQSTGSAGAQETETALKQLPRRRSIAKPPLRDAYNARAILAALASPGPVAVREAVANQLVAGKPARRASQLHARAIALLAAVAEAATASGSSPGLLPPKPESVRTLDDAVAAVIRALAPLRRTLLRAEDGAVAFYTAFERWVEERLADDLRLDAAARHFGLPPSTLTRRLERRYGLTFTGYVARRRVERAKTLLAQNKLSVDSVAKRVGLTDGAHLRKLLRRFEGSSPTRVRGAR